MQAAADEVLWFAKRLPMLKMRYKLQGDTFIKKNH